MLKTVWKARSFLWWPYVKALEFGASKAFLLRIALVLEWLDRPLRAYVRRHFNEV